MSTTNRRLAFGTAAMGATNFVKIGIQLVMLPLMARLLGPSEYGLYALAMPVVVFVMMLADGGLGASLAREPEENRNVWSSTFWALLFSGFVMAGVVIGSSYFLAATAHEPRLPGIMVPLAISIIFFVLSIPGNSRLIRRGHIEICALADVLGNVSGAGFAILLALHHAGAWSLVAQTTTIYFVRFLVSTTFAPVVPSLHLSFQDLKPHFAMGSAIIGGKLVDAGDKSIENAMMRRNFDAATLGSFSIANQIPPFLCAAVSNALWAALYTQTIRATDEHEVVRNYRKTIRVMALILFPMSALAAAEGQQLIGALLGNRWSGVSPMLQVLMISNTVSCAFVLGQSILYAKGMASAMFRITAESAVIRVLSVIAAPWIGMYGLIAGLALAGVYMGLRSLSFITRATGMPVFSILEQMRWPALCAALSGLFCWLAAEQLPHTFYIIIGNMVVSLTIYSFLLFAFERQALLEDFRNLKRLIWR